MHYITTAERIGIEKGMQQGMQQGMQRGVQKGVLKGEAAVLSRLLLHKFGTIPVKYRRRIAAADATMLLQWAEQVLDADNINDVFL